MIPTLIAANKYMYHRLVSSLSDLIAERLNVSNVFTVLDQVHRLAVVALEKRIVDLIQGQTAEILQSDTFVDIQRTYLQFLLSQPKLAATEMELLDGCVRWARAECKRNGVDDPQPFELQTVLGDLIYMINIFTFSLQQFCEGPLQTCLFSGEEIKWFLSDLPLAKPCNDSEFVYKFTQCPRLDSGFHRIDFDSGGLGGYRYCHSYVHRPKVCFSFSQRVYLKEIHYERYDTTICNRSAIQDFELLNQSGHRLNLSTEIESKFEFMKVIFDQFVTIQPEKFYLKFRWSCDCNKIKRPLKGVKGWRKGKNDALQCDFTFENLPICIKKLFLCLY